MVTASKSKSVLLMAIISLIFLFIGIVIGIILSTNDIFLISKEDNDPVSYTYDDSTYYESYTGPSPVSYVGLHELKSKNVIGTEDWTEYFSNPMGMAIKYSPDYVINESQEGIRNFFNIAQNEIKTPEIQIHNARYLDTEPQFTITDYDSAQYFNDNLTFNYEPLFFKFSEVKHTNVYEIDECNYRDEILSTTHSYVRADNQTELDLLFNNIKTYKICGDMDEVIVYETKNEAYDNFLKMLDTLVTYY